MSAESKLWDPPPKNGAQISSIKEPTPDWQELLKYSKYDYKLCLHISKLYINIVNIIF